MLKCQSYLIFRWGTVKLVYLQKGKELALATSAYNITHLLDGVFAKKNPMCFVSRFFLPV